MPQNTYHTISTQNKSHNISTNQISSNNASRYNQLIGVCNPSLMYQTQQCCSSNAKSSVPTSPKDSKVKVLSKKQLIKKDANDPICAFKLNSTNGPVMFKKSDRRRK